MHTKALQIIIVLLLVKPIIGHSQKLENSLLWEVKGEDIKTSYVYGTFHLLPQKDFVLKGKVSKAFDDSDQIVMEVDMDDPNMQGELMRNIRMKDGASLDDILGAQKYEQLSQFMMSRLNMPLDPLKTVKPFFLSSMILPTFVEGTPASYELVFVQRAQSQKKEILGLETPSFQAEIFDRISYEEQAEGLMEIIEDTLGNRALFDKMIAYYKNEEVNELYVKLVEHMKSDEQKKYLLTERNEDWISKIAGYAKETTTFFAVGAGHLAGENGVINLLKKAGYSVTPVSSEEE